MDLVDLIKNATKPPPAATTASSLSVFDVDEKLLKEIKRRCKDSAENIAEVARSKLFRFSICKGLKTITSCAGFLQAASSNSNDNSSNSSASIATGANAPMKITKDYASEIQNKVKELIELWDIRYGNDYPELHAMARYLRESLKVVMPNINKKAKEHEERIKEIERINKNKLLIRKNKVLKNELHDGIIDVETTLKGIDGCFAIIFPSVVAPTESIGENNKPEKKQMNKKRTIWECDGIELPVDDGGDGDGIDGDDDNHHNNNNNDNDNNIDYGQVIEPVKDNFSDVEWESDDEFPNQNSIVAGATPFTITIPIVQHVSEIESGENKVVIDTLKEHKVHLESVLLPKLIEWQELLTSTYDLCVVNSNNDEKLAHYEGLRALNQIVLTCQGMLQGRLRLLG